MAKKIITSWIIVVTLVLCGCNPIPIHSECDLPKLTADLKLDVVEKIETSSYFSHECRIELPTVMQLNRDWGVLNLRLHGSPHRLWMLAIGKNKGSLEIEFA